MNPKRVGFLGFDNVTALDLVGPSEAFACAQIRNDKNQAEKCYAVSLIGLTSKPFAAESGVIFQPNHTVKTAPELDTLIVPGGCGLREPEVNARVVAWIQKNAGRIRRIASVCTGLYGLAPTGLLDGRNVTTHWGFTQDIRKRFPKLKLSPNALFIKDGKFYTSAGVTAGIDLALSMIEEDFGPGVSLSVARELVVYLKRPGGQEQYSEPLQFQARATDSLSELVTWMRSHLHQDLSVETLAARANLCPRHFSRRFKESFGSTPALFVENLRLDEARRRLAQPNQSIKSVAASLGFRSDDAFRRAFERRLGIGPSSYRSRFATQPET